MGQTPIYQLPYPDPRLPLPYATPTSTPDVPTDVKQLADRLELVLPTSGPTRPAVTYGTTPPASPADGDLWYLPADTTAGVIWACRYRAGSSSTYKWEFVGGPTMYASDLPGAVETITSASTWTDTATIGPRITVPRAGDYDAIGGALFQQPSGGGLVVQLGPANGAATPALVAAASMTAGEYDTLAISGRLTGVAASTDIRLRYFASLASTGTVGSRWLRITPVRIS